MVVVAFYSATGNNPRKTNIHFMSFIPYWILYFFCLFNSLSSSPPLHFLLLQRYSRILKKYFFRWSSIVSCCVCIRPSNRIHQSSGESMPCTHTHTGLVSRQQTRTHTKHVPLVRLYRQKKIISGVVGLQYQWTRKLWVLSPFTPRSISKNGPCILDNDALHPSRPLFFFSPGTHRRTGTHSPAHAALCVTNKQRQWVPLM